MPRPPENPNAPLKARLNIPVSADLIAYLDSVRGSRTRAGYVRDLISSGMESSSVTEPQVEVQPTEPWPEDTSRRFIEAASKAHRHKANDSLIEWTDKGVKHSRYSCDCGQVVER